MEAVRCDLCGADDSRLYLRTTDRFTGMVYDLSICNQCNLVYLNPRPSQDEIKQHYPENYEAYRTLEQFESASERWYASRALVKQLDYIERLSPQRGRLLDIGCAAGNFLKIARERGWQVLGLEIMEEAARTAREHSNIEVLSTDLAHAHLLPGSFDAVTLWDVLEHLPSPKSDLLILNELVKPNGLVLFSVPNLDSYDRYLFNSEWIGWDAPRHLNLYDHSTISRLIAETGFEIVDRRCLLGGKGTFQLSLDRILQKKSGLKWLRRMYPIIGACLWPYRQFSYLRLKGPIIYYAVRKAGP